MSEFIQAVAKKALKHGKCVTKGSLLGLRTLECSFSKRGGIGEECVLFAVATLPTIGDELYQQAFLQGIQVGEWVLKPPGWGSRVEQCRWYGKLLRGNVEEGETLDKLFTLFYGVLDYTTGVAGES